jgi:hypothetical protein
VSLPITMASVSEPAHPIATACELAHPIVTACEPAHVHSYNMQNGPFKEL